LSFKTFAYLNVAGHPPCAHLLPGDPHSHSTSLKNGTQGMLKINM